MIYYQNKQQGYITLISVIAVTLIGTSIVVGLLLLGVNIFRTSISIEKSFEAKSLANACVEVALRMVRENTSYTGTDTLYIGSGSCTYTVANTGGESRTITASGTVIPTVRKVQIFITSINPMILYNSWQEEDF